MAQPQKPHNIPISTSMSSNFPKDFIAKIHAWESFQPQGL